MKILDPRTGYDLWAPDYKEDSNPVQVISTEAIERMLPDLRNRRVLDAGCGKGRISRLCLAKGASLAIGLDISHAMLALSPRNTYPGRHRLVAGDANALPFRKGCFDVVIAALMMGYNESIEPALHGFASVLAPGGILLISDFHPYATLRGWTRSFRDRNTGKQYQIEQHPHLFEAYFRIMKSEGLFWNELSEPLYEGYPLVFAIKATKTGSCRQ